MEMCRGGILGHQGLTRAGDTEAAAWMYSEQETLGWVGMGGKVDHSFGHDVPPS